MRRPPSIIDRRSVASARAPLATLRPLGTPSGYTRRNRLGGSTWWRPGRAAAGGHACLGEDPAGVGRHGGAPPSPPAAGCPWLAFLGTRRGGRLVVCRRERRGRRAKGGNRGPPGQRATARRVSRRRSCLSRGGTGRHRSAWGRAPIPPSGRVPMAGVSRNPQGREAGCLQARTKGAACGGRQSRGTWSAGTQAAQQGGDLVGLVGGQPVNAPLARRAVGAGRAAAVVAESEGRMRRVESGEAQQIRLGAQRVGAPGTPAHAALAIQAHDGQAGTAAAAHGRDHAGDVPGTPGRRVAGPVSQPPGPERLALHA